MREKLIEVLSENFAEFCNVDIIAGHCKIRAITFDADKFAGHLIANGVTIPVRCKDCKHWLYMEDGFGDCTNRRFHLDNHADPTMKADDFCSCGERRTDDR